VAHIVIKVGCVISLRPCNPFPAKPEERRPLVIEARNMDSSTAGTVGGYSCTTQFNRSLSPAGRLVFLALIYSNIVIVAAGFALIGAWLVMPFAGLEIVGLAVAFYLVARRDGDYERLTIIGQLVRFEACNHGVVHCFECNRAWVQLVRRLGSDGQTCQLTLRSHGRQVSIGRLMNDEQRLAWSQELATQLKTVNS
jgi:uncharacterized membrane protein